MVLSAITKRIITAVVLIAIVLGGLFYLPFYWFKILAAGVTLLGIWEASFLFWPNNMKLALVFFATCIALMFLNLYNLAYSDFILIAGAVWWFIAPMFLMQCAKKGGSIALKSGTKFFIGWFIFLPFLSSLLMLQVKFGPIFLLFALVLVWATDIGAFFVGIKWGENLLAPMISPKKTLEGLCGGVGLAILVAVGGGFLINIHGIKWVSWLLLCLITSLWSVIGDLFESMLKRQAGAKDSGNLLPGHGGVYDRIDSLTAALPIFALGLFTIING